MLSMLSDLSQELIQFDKSVDERIQTLLTRVGVSFECDNAFFGEINLNERILNVRYQWTRPGVFNNHDNWRNVDFDVDSFLEELFLGDPQIVDDIRDIPEGFTRTQLLSVGTKSIVAIPIKGDGSINGFIGISFSRNFHKFTEEEKNFHKTLGTLVLTLLGKDLFKHESILLAHKYNSSFSHLIGVLAKAVEKRDPYTTGHMERVAELSVRIGKKLGLADSELEGIHLGAVIHDVGKIYVPAEILNRPGKLLKQEFELIKTHSMVGHEIVKDIEFPWPIADIVLSHHERLDGSGYPNGLQGDEIAIEAQIVAVADVVEAVSSHRPYRPAKSIKEGLQIISEGKGKSYNPEIVEACIDIIENDGFVFPSAF